MAVQKSRVSRSRRGMRRSHDHASCPTLSIDPKTGTTHRRHHMTREGYYKGHLVMPQKKTDHSSTDETA